jgi:acetyl-CoA acetyltransferase
LREAYAWIKAESCEVALAFGVEITSSLAKGPLELPDDDWISQTGLNLPMLYAMQAARHIEAYGTSREQLAAVSVKSRRLGALNPKAHFQSETTLDDVLSSRPIADPLTLLQCCPKTDGGSAVVLAGEQFIRRRGLNPTWVRTSALGSGVPVYGDGSDVMPTPKRIAHQAFEAAGIGPSDLDVVEVHDAFSIGEIIYSEAVGICAPGEGGRYAAEGRSLPNAGGVAVNTSGGLLSRGHPIGASGLGQVYELVSQLRGTAGKRQVNNARLALAHNMGASVFELDANVCSVLILEKG